MARRERERRGRLCAMATVAALVLGLCAACSPSVTVASRRCDLPPVPDPGVSRGLAGIGFQYDYPRQGAAVSAVPGARQAWALGGAYTGPGIGSRYLLRFNGLTWTRVAKFGKRIMARWDGTAWHEVPVPATTFTSASDATFALATSGPANTWVADQRVPRTVPDLTEVTMAGPDAWAITTPPGSHAQVLRTSTGSGWCPQPPLPGPSHRGCTSALEGISAASPTYVVAVGGSYHPGCFFAYVYDGHSWRPVDSRPVSQAPGPSRS